MVVSAILFAGLTALQAPTAFANQAVAAKPLPPLPQQNPSLKRPKSKRFTASALHQRLDMRPSSWLGAGDELATLHAIHTALSSVGDGGAYVWQRRNGLLDGLIRPTTSFKDRAGNICRHIIIRLNSKSYSREIEGVACRDTTGAWSLSG